MHNYAARLLRCVGFKCPSAFAQGQLPKDKKGSHYWLYLFTCNLQQMHITLSAGRSINWQRAVTIYQQGCRVERLPRLQPVMMSSNTSNRPLKSRRSALCMCDGELGAEGGGWVGGAAVGDQNMGLKDPTGGGVPFSSARIQKGSFAFQWWVNASELSARTFLCVYGGRRSFSDCFHPLLPFCSRRT